MELTVKRHYYASPDPGFPEYKSGIIIDRRIPITFRPRDQAKGSCWYETPSIIASYPGPKYDTSTRVRKRGCVGLLGTEGHKCQFMDRLARENNHALAFRTKRDGFLRVSRNSKIARQQFAHLEACHDVFVSSEGSEDRNTGPIMSDFM
jgi:hypothetical protein